MFICTSTVYILLQKSFFTLKGNVSLSSLYMLVKLATSYVRIVRCFLHVEMEQLTHLFQQTKLNRHEMSLALSPTSPSGAPSWRQPHRNTFFLLFNSLFFVIQKKSNTINLKDKKNIASSRSLYCVRHISSLTGDEGSSSALLSAGSASATQEVFIKQNNINYNFQHPGCSTAPVVIRSPSFFSGSSFSVTEQTCWCCIKTNSFELILISYLHR